MTSPRAEEPEARFLEHLADEFGREELRALQEEAAGHALRPDADRRRPAELFEQLPDPHVITDPQGNVRDANRAALRLLDRRKRYLLGKPLAALLSSEHVEELRAKIARLVHSPGAAAHPWEAAVRTRSGEARPVSISVRGIRSPHGALSGFCWLLRALRK